MRLEVTDLSVRFGGLTALDSVSLSVEPGSILGLIGPNGAGKTTLFNTVSGFVRPVHGHVLLDGRDVTRMGSARRSRLGLARTFQVPGLVRPASVVANLVMAQHATMRSGVAGGIVGLGAGEDDILRQRAMGVLEQLALAPFAGRPVATLPHGLLKVVELAAAVLRQPRLLLLDEPSAGLDRTETRLLADHLLTLHAEFGFTTVVIDHDMQLVRRLAGDITVLSFGRVIASGSWDAIREDPAVIEAYLGSEAGADDEVRTLAPS